MNKSPEKHLEYATMVVAKLQDNGFTTYFAGGCVRDALLGKHPLDYDIATAATPEQVHNIFPNTISVGKSFGVNLVPMHNEWFEVATFRTDADYHNGRHPPHRHCSPPTSSTATSRPLHKLL